MKKQNKVFTSVNDLKDLSHIPEGKKKKRMTKNVAALSAAMVVYKQSWSAFNTAKEQLEAAAPIKDLSTYRIKRALVRQYANAENQILIDKSKLSKLINSLILDHVTHDGKENDATVDEIYKIVAAYENKEFTDNYFPTRRLNAINKNNTALRNNELSLEVCKLVISNKLQGAKNKTKEYYAKQIPILERKIQLCKDKKASLFDTFKSMQYAKLIKRFNDLSHKYNKHDKLNHISSEYVIDFENITKYYFNKWMANKILKGFDLKIKRGEFVVILGPSGSGKTTLLNIMSGMDKATYGRTIVNGHNLIKMNDNQLTQFRKDNIGYIFQQYGLLPNLNVRENVEIGWNLQSDKSKRLDIDQLLKTVGMEMHANKFPHELSGGQQQRVSVARSMAKNPAIVFGDEPTGAVDEEMSKQILQLFVDINKKYKTTVIIVTHNPIFADLATRVIKVNSGMIAQNYINKHPKKVEELDWSSTH